MGGDDDAALLSPSHLHSLSWNSISMTCPSPLATPPPPSHTAGDEASSRGGYFGGSDIISLSRPPSHPCSSVPMFRRPPGPLASAR
ncbi:hypothetical protein MRB53_040747 [Persea americana]|nr:hypothetical protein MRB53_040747 [Persea americana]